MCGGRGQGCGSPEEKGAGGLRETGEERAASAREIEKSASFRYLLLLTSKETAYIQRMYIPLTYKETNPTTFFDFYLTFSEA